MPDRPAIVEEVGLRAIEFHTCVGILPQERVQPQRLLCDVVPPPPPGFESWAAFDASLRAHARQLKADPNLQVMEQEGLNVGYLAYNAQQKPFDDVRVRRALARLDTILSRLPPGHITAGRPSPCSSYGRAREGRTPVACCGSAASRGGSIFGRASCAAVGAL